MRTIARSIALTALVTATAGCGVSSDCQTSMGGQAWGEMPDLETSVGDTVKIDVWRYFLPEWCQFSPFSDGFEFEWTDSAAVAVSIDYRHEILTIAALAVAESVRVRVWSAASGVIKGLEPKDGNPGTRDTFYDFHVRVRPDE